MSQTMRCRPSAVLGIHESLTAFYVDRACWTLASVIEQDQDLAEKRLPKNAKEAAHTRARQRVLDQYLGIEEANEPSRFRTVGG